MIRTRTAGKFVSSLVCLLVLSVATAAADEPGDAGKFELSPDTVLTRRGPVEVTVREFEAALARVPSDQRQSFADDPERIAQLLERLARNELLAAKAREAGLEERDDVQTRIREAKAEVLAHAMVEHVQEKAPVADYAQQAKEYYLTHKDEFRLPERVDVSHVLISTRQRDDDAARALAEKVAQAARDGERPFEELVKEYSEDPSASRNLGRFDNVQRGQMVQPFEDAAFNLKDPGDIAGPVKTQYGYHVIRLNSHKPPAQQPFEQVKDELIVKMRKQHREQVVQQYVGKLLEENPLEADESVIRALRERYRPKDQ